MFIILPILYMFIIYFFMIHFVLMYLVIFVSYQVSFNLILHVIMSYYTLMYISYDNVRIKLPLHPSRSPPAINMGRPFCVKP